MRSNTADNSTTGSGGAMTGAPNTPNAQPGDAGSAQAVPPPGPDNGGTLNPRAPSNARYPFVASGCGKQREGGAFGSSLFLGYAIIARTWPAALVPRSHFGPLPQQVMIERSQR